MVKVWEASGVVFEGWRLGEAGEYIVEKGNCGWRMGNYG